jgi:hypothetical protein
MVSLRRCLKPSVADIQTNFPHSSCKLLPFTMLSVTLPLINWEFLFVVTSQLYQEKTSRSGASYLSKTQNFSTQISFNNLLRFPFQ